MFEKQFIYVSYICYRNDSPSKRQRVLRREYCLQSELHSAPAQGAAKRTSSQRQGAWQTPLIIHTLNRRVLPVTACYLTLSTVGM